MLVAPKAVHASQFDDSTRHSRMPLASGKSASQQRIVKSATFSGACRLLRADGYGHVLKAKSISEKHFKIFFVDNFRPNARLGIVASKKILPRSVDRNHIKRIVREVFRAHSIRALKLDVVVLLRQAYTPHRNIQRDHLERMFYQVENRCAQL